MKPTLVPNLFAFYLIATITSSCGSSILKGPGEKKSGANAGATASNTGTGTGTGGDAGALSTSTSSNSSTSTETTTGSGINIGTGTDALVCGFRKLKINNNCVDARPFYEWFHTGNSRYLYTADADKSCERPSSLTVLTSAIPCPNGQPEFLHGGGWSYSKLAFYTFTLEGEQQISEINRYSKLYRYYNSQEGYHKFDLNLISVSPFNKEKTHLVFSTQEAGTTRLFHYTKNGDNTVHYYTTVPNWGSGNPSFTLDSASPAYYVFGP